MGLRLATSARLFSWLRASHLSRVPSSEVHMNDSQKARVVDRIRKFGKNKMEVNGLSCQVSAYIWELSLWCGTFRIDDVEGMSEDPVAKAAWETSTEFEPASIHFIQVFGSDEEIPTIKVEYGNMVEVFKAIRKGPECLEGLRALDAKYSPGSDLIEETETMVQFRSAFKSEVDSLIADLVDLSAQA